MPRVMEDGTIFDAAFYAEQNPDVCAAVGTDENALYNHYQNCGKLEGRAPAGAEAGEMASFLARLHLSKKVLDKYTLL